MASSTEVLEELISSIQAISDYSLAWQLQAEEYRKNYQVSSHSISSTSSALKSLTPTFYQFQDPQGKSLSFNLKPTSPDGNCFFHAVDRPGFNREALVKKLLDNATDEAVLSIFAHEIRQFLYLGHTGFHDNEQENKACQKLLTDDVKELFSTFSKAEEALDAKIREARSELGKEQTHGKLPEELLNLLSQKGSNLKGKFEEAYQAVLSANKVIYQYCCQEPIFRQYVELYLREARGYIPFSRDFGIEIPTTTIDVINRLFQLRIQVYLPNKTNKTQLMLANQLQSGDVIPVFHNGINHFWGLITPSLQNTNSNESGEIVPHSSGIDPTLMLKEFAHLTQGIVSFQTLSRRETLKNIVSNPHHFGLEKEGLCYALINGKYENVEENKLISQIKERDETDEVLKEALDEKDSQYKNTALHWCATLNYSKLANFLLKEGFVEQKTATNGMGLTPTQTAVLFRNNEFILSELSRKPEFTHLTIQCKNAKEETVIFKLNELHLAILSKNIELMGAIFQTFKDKHVNIELEMKGIGNILHLLVYFVDGKTQAKKEKRPSMETLSDAIEMFQLLMKQPSQRKIIDLLTQHAGNWEGCTPLMLAAKYDQAGLLSQFITYLKLDVEKASGVREIEKAFYIAVEHGKNNVVQIMLYFYGFRPDLSQPGYLSIRDKLTTDPALRRIKGIIDARASEDYYAIYVKPKPETQPYENLVLQGGGGKGLAYPYVLKALKEQCEVRRRGESGFAGGALSFDHITRVAGTSVGSIFAMGLAIGCSLEKMEKELDYDFKEFLENETVDKIARELNAQGFNLNRVLDDLLKEFGVALGGVRKAYSEVSTSRHPRLNALWQAATQGRSIYRQCEQAFNKIRKLNEQFNGFSTGTKLYQFLEKFIREEGLSPDLTFGELAEKVRIDQGRKFKHLHVVVTNLSQGVFEVLSSENPVYSNYLILDAVRASAAYPIVFTPHHLRIKEAGTIKTLSDEYVDGGALRNYAIDEFDLKKYTNNDWIGDPKYPEFNKNTIGIRFKVEESHDRKALTSSPTILSRIGAFLSFYMEAEQLISQYMDREYHRSIVLNTGNITTFTFKKLEEEEKRFLKEASQTAVKDYFAEKRDIDEERTSSLSLPLLPAASEPVERLKSSAYYKEREYIAHELELYVPPFSCDPETNPYAISDTEQLPFLEDTIIKNFFKGKEKVLLLKGGPGSGKTLFGCYLEKAFWDKFENPEDPIVIFIYLPHIKDPLDNLIGEYFTRKFGSNAGEMINALKARKQVYFVFDAYDEIEEFQKDPTSVRNLYESNQLYQWTEAKFIISCRTSFLNRVSDLSSDHSYKKYFAPAGLDRPCYDLLKIVQVALFNKEQINVYIDRYVKLRNQDTLSPLEWNTQQYKDEINSLPNVEELVRSPLLLRMTVQALPIIVAWHTAKKKSSPDSFVTITERDVFLAYLKDNLNRTESRLIHGGRKIPANLKTKFLDFLINLSDMMTRNTLLKVGYKFLPGEADEGGIDEGPEWARRFFGDPFLGRDENRLKYLEMIRNNLTCLLIYEDEQWSFIHDSFIGKLDSINIVELTNVESKLRLTLGPKEARTKSIDEFSRVLFSEPEGHYYLTKNSEWASMRGTRDKAVEEEPSVGGHGSLLSKKDAENTLNLPTQAQIRANAIEAGIPLRYSVPAAVPVLSNQVGSSSTGNDIANEELRKEENLLFSTQTTKIALELRQNSANPEVLADTSYSELVKKAISFKVHLTQSSNGNTALHWAFLKSQFDKAIILLREIKRSDNEAIKILEVKNKNGKTILELFNEQRSTLPSELRQLMEELLSSSQIQSLRSAVEPSIIERS